MTQPRRLAARGSVFLLGLVLFASSGFAQSTDRARQIVEMGSTPTLFDNPDLVKTYQNTITASDLAAHLYLFASDFFEGRETSARGQKLAANYLASQYRKFGLQPKGTANPSDPYAPSAYYQPFDVYGSRFKQATLTASRNGSQMASSTYGGSATDGKSVLSFGSGSGIEGPLVFGGYGIADDELGYNDIAALQAAGIDPTEGWLMILNDEPMSSADKSLLPTENGELSQWSGSRFAKLAAFRDPANPRSINGPKGILVVGDTSPREEMSVSDMAMQSAAGSGGVGGLSLSPPDDSQGGGRRSSFPPMFTISKAFANQLLAPSGKTIDDLKKSIDSSLKPNVFKVEGVTLTGGVENESFKASSENVAAFIEGSDPDLKDEVVIISSHYDHIGMRNVPEGEDGINNGADDDGSGTVSVLEMAEAFQKAKDDGYGPRRSILFLNVAGEEKGLLGSQYYADHEPILPLEKTVTDLNIDMIGRIDPTHPGPNSDYVYIIGSNLISQELHNINQKANKVMGINLDLNERYNSKDDPNQFYRRSDHWNFGKHSIPFIFFFTGTHEDYHQPGDEPQKIEYDRMARIVQMIFGTAWQVANQDAPPAVSGTGFN